MRRRTLLGWGATLTLAGSPAVSQLADAQRHRRLLVLLLRGAMDGLTALPPTGDPELMALRSRLVPERLLPGNDFFGVHPVLPTFAELLAQGQAAAVHATGFDYRGRSHFEGQDLMQSGVAKPYTSASGWLGRAMEQAALGSGVAISIPMPLLLRGDVGAETQYPSWMQPPPPSTYALVSELWQTSPELAELGQRMSRSRRDAAAGPMAMGGRLRSANRQRVWPVRPRNACVQTTVPWWA